MIDDDTNDAAGLPDPSWSSFSMLIVKCELLITCVAEHRSELKIDIINEWLNDWLIDNINLRLFYCRHNAQLLQ